MGLSSNVMNMKFMKNAAEAPETPATLKLRDASEWALPNRDKYTRIKKPTVEVVGYGSIASLLRLRPAESPEEPTAPVPQKVRFFSWLFSST